MIRFFLALACVCLWTGAADAQLLHRNHSAGCSGAKAATGCSGAKVQAGCSGFRAAAACSGSQTTGCFGVKTSTVTTTTVRVVQVQPAAKVVRVERPAQVQAASSVGSHHQREGFLAKRLAGRCK